MRADEEERREEVLEGRLEVEGGHSVTASCGGERAYLPDRERRRSASNHLHFNFASSTLLTTTTRL